MATLHVRNVPDELYELLRERAAANDRSIGAETVQLLQERLAVGTARPLPLPGLRRRTARSGGPLTRFTDEARRAVVVAQQEARALGHGQVGSEHLLLGVLAQDVPATAALGRIGVAFERVRSELEPGPEPASRQLRFAPDAKEALELALREAVAHGGRIIAPRHLVLGIAGAETGRGAEILRIAEPDPERLRTRLLGPLPVEFHAGGARVPIDPSFRVVQLEGEPAEWEAQLNDAAALGYELVEIVERRAIFRR
jgi:plasmid stability protein